MLSDCQNLNRLTGYRGRLHSAHWLACSLKLAARCPVSGCWPSCFNLHIRLLCANEYVLKAKAARPLNSDEVTQIKVGC